jgi:rhodanese-related sulfurtransferase
LRNILLGLLCVIICFKAFSQQKTATTDDFSQMVNEYLSFSVPVINTEDLYKIRNEIVLLDARELEEYNVSHIKNAIFIGYKNFDKSKLKGIPKNKKIVVYCSIGYRSEKIGEQLQKLGYKNVYNLYGSLFAWVNRGYEVVDANNKITYTVHGYDATWAKWITNKRYKKVY